MKFFRFGSRPGATRANNAHSSVRLFSNGVPLMATVNFRSNPVITENALLVWFFTDCASSSITPAKEMAWYCSASSRSSV